MRDLVEGCPGIPWPAGAQIEVRIQIQDQQASYPSRRVAWGILVLLREPSRESLICSPGDLVAPAEHDGYKGPVQHV